MLRACIRTSLAQHSLTIDLAIKQGTIFGVYGPSGAGKSSFLSCLSGVISGQFVENHGHNLTDTLPEQRGICHQLQACTLFPHLDVAGNLAFAWRHRPKNNNGISVTEVVSQLAIGDLLARSINSLSGGEKQRVMFARTLLVGQDIILLDEPFSALDWQKKAIMLSAINYFSAQRNITFVIVSHSLKELAFCSQELLYLVAGRAEACGTYNYVMHKINTLEKTRPFSYVKLSDIDYIDEQQQYQLTLATSEQCLFSRSRKNLVADHVCIYADNVNIRLQKELNTSQQNQLTGQLALVEQSAFEVVAQIEVDGQNILCSVTQENWRRLNLQLGDTVVIEMGAI